MGFTRKPTKSPQGSRPRMPSTSRSHGSSRRRRRAASNEARGRSVQALRGERARPAPDDGRVSSALQSSPDIVLREFGWTYSGAEIEKGREAPRAFRCRRRHPARRRQAAGRAPSSRARSARSGAITAQRSHDRQRSLSGCGKTHTSPKCARPRCRSTSARTRCSRATRSMRAEAPATAEFELLIVFKPRI